jgi:prepilin-type processing-associated H-X9-DG protein/prepilin-type N-terminal cleavage/methylation domain-containing protein
MTKRCSFTLIELLVVVAIVAVLVAILLPALAQARERARAAISLANEKQMGTGFEMFLRDNQDTYPMQYQLVGSPRTWPCDTWLYVLGTAYVTNAAVFHCPSDMSPDHPLYQGSMLAVPWGPLHPAPDTGGGGYLCTWTSYGMNGYFTSAWPPYTVGTWWAPAIKLSAVEGVTLLVGDAHASIGNPFSAFVGNWVDVDSEVPSGWVCTSVSARHNRGANFLFTDGHAEWCAATGVFNLKWKPRAN